MSKFVFAQIREESAFCPNFGEIYTGIVSCAVSSIESHECVIRAEPARADVGYGQRFQAIQKCWKRWSLVDSWLHFAFLLRKFLLLSMWALTVVKGADFGSCLENNVAKNSVQCHLEMFPCFIWCFRGVFSPFKLLLSTHLIALQHYKYCWKQITPNQTLRLKKHPWPVS